MLGAHSPADLEPVDARKHEVEHDQVRRRRSNGVERGRSVGYGNDGVAGSLEIADDDLGHSRVVIDDEDARHDHRV
jgi:hypothetical protein